MSPRRHSAACERNRDPILAVLRRVLPAQGAVLELAAGTGQHAAYFSDALTGLEWQPTDADPEALASIDAWTAESRGTARPALHLDVTALPWPIARTDAVLCCNMIHIAPFRACEALLLGAGRVLGAGGLLLLYGPFKREGKHTAPSNEEFDAWLKARDPSCGVRELETVVELAARQGLALREVVEMPANNLLVLFGR